MGDKISNILGVPIPFWVMEQINLRSSKLSAIERTNEDLLYFSNNTCFCRLISSIDVSGDALRVFKELYPDIRLGDKTSLAKKFVLSNGVSEYDGSGFRMRSGLDAYSITGKAEVQKFGYSPMPGITNASVETIGRLGSLRTATINFKVYNKSQLDIMDTLYFKLGYTMFFEWGRTMYFDNNGNLQSAHRFDHSLLFQSTPKEQILAEIQASVRRSDGNYDAMFGIVKDFKFTRRDDESYDCYVKLIGLGILAESMKTNRTANMPPFLEVQARQLLEYVNKQIEEEVRAESQEEVTRIKNEAKQEEDKIKEQINSLYYNSFVVVLLREYDPRISSGIRWNIPITDYTDLMKTPKVQRRDLSEYLESSDGKDKLVKTPYVGNQVESTTTLSNLEDLRRNSYKVKDGIVIGPINKKLSIGLGSESDTVILNSEKILSKLSDSSITNISFQEKFRVSQGSTAYSTGNSYTVAGAVSSYPRFDPIWKLEIYTPLIGDRGIGLDNNIPVQDILLESTLENWFIILKNHLTKNKTIGATVKEVAYNEESNIVTIALKTNIEYQGNLVESIVISNGASVPTPVKYTVPITIVIQDTSLIQDIPNVKPYLSEQEFEETIKKAENTLKEAQERSEQAIRDAQIDIKQVVQFEQNRQQSSIEFLLRSIQLYSLNQNENIASNSVQEVKLHGNNFYSEVLSSVGLLKTDLKRLIENPDSITDLEDPLALKSAKSEDVFLYYAKYGFNHNVMSNSISNKESLRGIKVDYKDLLMSYVVPYEVTMDFADRPISSRPVYIKLGTFLMLLNHVGLVYEESQNRKFPMNYIDFNPNTNFCLSSPTHFSCDPLKFLVRFSGTKDEYKKLFDDNVLTGDTIVSKKTEGSDDSTASQLFLSTDSESDVISPFLPKFKVDSNNYKGNLMNVLVEIEYLLSLFRRFSTEDNTNSVYLKPLLEQVLADMCKAFGNFNVLRLAYNDASNCFYIIDDQVTPGASKEPTLKTTNTTEIPMIGKGSIVSTMDISTDISSRLANMIAISANSSGGVDSVDGSIFGASKLLVDRFSFNKSSDAEPKEKTKNVSVALRFNEEVKKIYSSRNPNQEGLYTAQNYYIGKLSGVKESDESTRSSIMIPVGVNFTTDGLSGLTMYQSFTISDMLLPASYRKFEKNRDVGFCVTGLVQNIDMNVWTTSVKSQMIFVKDRTYASTEIVRDAPSQTQRTREVSPIFVSRDSRNGDLDDIDLRELRPDLNSKHNNRAQNISDGGRVRLQPPAMDQLEKLLDAASKDGVHLMINSAYRTLADQDRIFKQYQSNPGRAARPGTSNHGLGVAVDFANRAGRRLLRGSTEHNWLLLNGSKFQFFLRYGNANESHHFEFTGPVKIGRAIKVPTDD